MTDNATLNYSWSQAMIGGFVAAGACEAVISPGSRSTPLTLAILRQPGLRSHIAVDERNAAFFALGIGKASRQPVLLLATSGSAPAHWLPAVIEASQANVPLILLSADRPPELHGCGANQTINQLGMFGDHVRASHALGTPESGFDPAYLHRLTARVVEQTIWPHPGPVHLNLPFREPLVPSAAVAPPIVPSTIKVSRPKPSLFATDVADLAQRMSGRPGVIVCGVMDCGAEEMNAIAMLAARLDCPILAEPLSGLRFGPHDRKHLFVRYNAWLANPDFAPLPPAEWVLRFGAFPVTRNLQNYLANIRNTHALVEASPRWSDPVHCLTHVLRTEPADACAALAGQLSAPCPQGWRQLFTERETVTAQTAESDHIGILLDELTPGAPLFVGNSLAIREIDTYSGTSSKPLLFFGNRGASGIDGNISTAMGIAAVHGRVAALIGDLTCQHDLGGLALAQGRDAVIVTVNNGGGGIFEHLPQRQLPEFETGWQTPQKISFEHAAKTFGLCYRHADTLSKFREQVRAAQIERGPHLIELNLPLKP